MRMKSRAFNLGDQRIFFRQLQVLFSASIMLADALSILQRGETNQEKADVIKRICQGLMTGHSLSASMNQEKGVFSRRVVSLIHLGEEGGGLGDTLHIVADELESQEQTTEKIRAALYYPLSLALCSIAGVAGLLFFFLPRMVGFAASLNTELPAFVTSLFRLTSMLSNPWVSFALLQIFIAFLAALYLGSKTAAARRLLDQVLLSNPLTGELTLHLNCFQLASGLRALLLCGCPLATALKLLTPTLGNSVIRGRLRQAAMLIELEGSHLGEALERQGVFPNALVSLIACGEESGTLDGILDVAANFYRERLDERLEQMTALIEPAILLFLGITVGVITLLFFLPMVKVVAAL